MGLCAGCTVTNKADYAQRVRTARQAEYDLPRDEIMEAMLTVILRGYRIERQSDAEGLVETEWADDIRAGMHRRVRVVARIEGDRPYRVAFSARAEAAKVVGGQVGAWAPTDSTRYEDELYLALHGILAKDIKPLIRGSRAAGP